MLHKVVANPDDAGPGWTVDQVFYTEFLVPATDMEPVVNGNYSETRSKTVHHVVRTPQFLMRQEPDQTIKEAQEGAAAAMRAAGMDRQALMQLEKKHQELQGVLAAKDNAIKSHEQTIQTLRDAVKSVEEMLAGAQKQRDLAQDDLKVVVGYVGTQVYERLIHAREAEAAVARMGAPGGKP